ncbi:MXAN_2562 family outer membrane beta-barrel protein [Anaeromyxobacter oryzae]|uniref:Outer membrane protein beta-barrel domain-containing protein n=1 Tax=Anaeromyxobacter oryzae TaxID=2918170 RepID=A0ABN6MN64_9BACT|nr:MXAN_2562 family outer membrane beta-barrel protein [Anaeromyxobacter oryzae]BDG02451.1 hypothetical protein AMOR_14470 [Anaeromyxobacter oryzae]
MRGARLAVAALAALALAPAVARAQARHSPISGSFELGATYSYPNMDADFAPSTTFPLGHGPWEQVFGSRSRWGFRAGISRMVYNKVGTVELGFRSGFLSASGKGFSNMATDGQPPVWVRSEADTTTFHMIPTSLMATYRFDWAADRVPLVPYVRLALERYNWWVTDGAGKTSQKGATNGWSATGGLAFLLDWFDPGLARELDADSGVNHTYLYFDVTRAKVDDFGSKKSWDLSDKHVAYSAGLLFIY